MPDGELVLFDDGPIDGLFDGFDESCNDGAVDGLLLGCLDAPDTGDGQYSFVGINDKDGFELSVKDVLSDGPWLSDGPLNASEVGSDDGVLV